MENISEIVLNGLIWYAVFLFSTTLHEAAHALVALKLGDDTAYLGGQVSLDPIPHMRREIVGMLIVPLVSFVFYQFKWMLGWASAPYNPVWARRYPKFAAYMALAGPLANASLAIVAVIFIHLGIHLGYFFEPNSIVFASVVGAFDSGIPTIAAKFFSILFSLNLLLFIFNLIPLPPMDGSALFPLVVSEDRALKIMDALHQPGLSLVGIIIAWMIFGELFRPIFLIAVNLLYPGLTYH